MTVVDLEQRRARCGAAIVRCGGCGNSVAKPLDTCPRCGSVDLGPGTCRRWPKGRSSRCDLHGGGSPQVLRKGAVADLEARAARAVAQMGWDPIENSVEALADLVGEMVAGKDIARQALGELASLTVTDQLGREDAGAIVQVYERFLDRCERGLVHLASLGLEERRVRLSEQQGELVAAVITRVLARAGVDPAAVDVRSWVAEELETAEKAS